MVILRGTWANVFFSNFSQCFGRTRRPSSCKRLYSGVEGNGVSWPNTGKPGGHVRICCSIRTWPPGLPVFGQLTPFPSTPLYKRLQEDGRLVRPKHWLKFEKNTLAHVPLRMTIEQTHKELAYAWTHSYDAARNAEAVKAMSYAPVGPRIFHLITRFAFRA